MAPVIAGNTDKPLAITPVTIAASVVILVVVSASPAEPVVFCVLVTGLC